MLLTTTRENPAHWWKCFKQIFADTIYEHVIVGSRQGAIPWGLWWLTSHIHEDEDRACLAWIDLKHTSLEGMAFFCALYFLSSLQSYIQLPSPCPDAGGSSWSPTTQCCWQHPEVKGQWESSRVERTWCPWSQAHVDLHLLVFFVHLVNALNLGCLLTNWAIILQDICEIWK